MFGLCDLQITYIIQTQACLCYASTLSMLSQTACLVAAHSKHFTCQHLQVLQVINISLSVRNRSYRSSTAILCLIVWVVKSEQCSMVCSQFRVLIRMKLLDVTSNMTHVQSYSTYTNTSLHTAVYDLPLHVVPWPVFYKLGVYLRPERLAITILLLSWYTTCVVHVHACVHVLGFCIVLNPSFIT